ncbi:MAG: hypothetical protein C0508_31590 [Cyanobacteria bacterium PR.023]|nr:hypothetical protein [Cyanobacteria bacterium PR.023]
MANSSAKILEFADEILLSDSKHVGKLFPLSKGNATIVSNGNTIDGVALMEPPNHLLKADFKSGAGTIIMNNRNICRIVSNEFRSSLKPVADILKVVLADELSAEEQAKVADIVKAAEENKFGCTLVLDPKETLQKLSGHYLSEPALDTELVAGMAKVDGATLIDSKGAIRAFGCILDGTAGENERLARGARYNSARRFSLAHSNSSIIIIVVSSDGPLSIFKEGAEIYSDPWSYNLKRLDDYGEKITGVATNDFSIQGQI